MCARIRQSREISQENFHYKILKFFTYPAGLLLWLLLDEPESDETDKTLT